MARLLNEENHSDPFNKEANKLCTTRCQPLSPHTSSIFIPVPVPAPLLFSIEMSPSSDSINVEILSSARRNVHVFSHPRTASNLLCHLLSNQPGWTEAKYHFAPAFDLTRKSLDEGRLGDIEPEQYQQLDKMMRDGLEHLYRDYNRALDEVGLCPLLDSSQRFADR